MKLLLVEDDFVVAQNICEYLEAGSHIVDWAPDGHIGLDNVTSQQYDLIILDITLPKMSGIELCKRIRDIGYKNIPILILTALGELDSKIQAYEAGADDYVIKPFSLKEIELRINALLKRSTNRDSNACLVVDELQYDTSTLVVKRKDKEIDLPKKAKMILEILMRNTHRVVTKEEIEKAVWNDSLPDKDTLRIHIHALRNAIDKPFNKQLLKTIHGVGYRIIK